MFNCLWCSSAPTAAGPWGEGLVQGLTFPFHSQPHAHMDWEMYQCSSLQHSSNYQTQTKMEPLSAEIGIEFFGDHWAAYALHSTKPSQIHSE